MTIDDHNAPSRNQVGTTLCMCTSPPTPTRPPPRPPRSPSSPPPPTSPYLRSHPSWKVKCFLLSTRKPDHDPTCWECCRRLPVSEVPVGNLLFLRWSFNLEYLRNYPSTWYLQKVLLKAFDGSFKRRIQRWRLLVLNLFLQLLLFSNFLCTFGPFYSCLL